VQLVLAVSQVKHCDAQGSQLAEEPLLLVLEALFRKKPSPHEESMSMQRWPLSFLPFYSVVVTPLQLVHWVDETEHVKQELSQARNRKSIKGFIVKMEILLLWFTFACESVSISEESITTISVIYAGVSYRWGGTTGRCSCSYARFEVFTRFAGSTGC